MSVGGGVPADGGGGSGNMGVNLLLESELPSGPALDPNEECLKERKWWCFLLSSIFTFLMGVLSVLVVRVIFLVISLCKELVHSFNDIIKKIMSR